MKKAFAAIAATGALLALPAAAEAHITLQPSEAASESFTVLEVRVPNETDNANTTKVDLKLPPGFISASYQPVPGWSVKVSTQKLSKPVQTDDGPVSEQVREMVWTGDGKAGRIAPGQFQDFPISVQIPGKEGDTLTFKAIQTYDDGEIVRWIGPPSAEEPAPQVHVTAPEPEGGHMAEAASGGSGGEQASSDSDGDSDSASKGLGIAALILGGLGLIAGGVALVRTRRGVSTS
jgi:uncharacterized protein